jgi:hypothetical protein
MAQAQSITVRAPILRITRLRARWPSPDGYRILPVASLEEGLFCPTF